MPTKIRKILSVDDNDMDLCVHVRRVHKYDPDIDVRDAVDGRAAFDVLKKTGFWPDLILLDVNMPVLDGFGFLDLCAQEFGAHTPPVVLMLTSMFQDRDIERIAQYPMIAGHMTKPLGVGWFEQVDVMLENHKSQV